MTWSFEPETGRRVPPSRAVPLGLEHTQVLTHAPATAGVGLRIPPRNTDPCCVQYFAVQRAICDLDAADPMPLTRRHLTTDPET